MDIETLLKFGSSIIQTNVAKSLIQTIHNEAAMTLFENTIDRDWSMNFVIIREICSIYLSNNYEDYINHFFECI